MKSRENNVVTALVVLGVGIGMTALDMIALGGSLVSLFSGLLAASALHYLWWGHALTKEVAAEREAFLRQQEGEAPPLTQAPADAIQDLARTRGIQKR